MQITWKPVDHGEPRSALPASAFAFPAERKEPLTDAAHVRDAISRFSQVRGVTDAQRAQAFVNIRSAAAYYDVPLRARSWQDLITRT